jgi:hypothetical protein
MEKSKNIEEEAMCMIPNNRNSRIVSAYLMMDRLIGLKWKLKNRGNLLKSLGKMKGLVHDNMFPIYLLIGCIFIVLYNGDIIYKRSNK